MVIPVTPDCPSRTQGIRYQMTGGIRMLFVQTYSSCSMNRNISSRAARRRINRQNLETDATTCNVSTFVLSAHTVSRGMTLAWMSDLK